MSYARFTKQHYDRALTFAENAKRISAMWRSQKKGSGRFGSDKPRVNVAGGEELRRQREEMLRIYPIGQGKKKKKKGGCRCGKGTIRDMIKKAQEQKTISYPAVCGKPWSNC